MGLKLSETLIGRGLEGSFKTLVEFRQGISQAVCIRIRHIIRIISNLFSHPQKYSHIIYIFSKSILPSNEMFVVDEARKKIIHIFVVLYYLC